MRNTSVKCVYICTYVCTDAYLHIYVCLVCIWTHIFQTYSFCLDEFSRCSHKHVYKHCVRGRAGVGGSDSGCISWHRCQKDYHQTVHGPWNTGVERGVVTQTGPFLHRKVLMTGEQKSASRSAQGHIKPTQYHNKPASTKRPQPPRTDSYSQKHQQRDVPSTYRGWKQWALAGDAPWFLPAQPCAKRQVPVKEACTCVPRQHSNRNQLTCNEGKVQHAGQIPRERLLSQKHCQD